MRIIGECNIRNIHQLDGDKIPDDIAGIGPSYRAYTSRDTGARAALSVCGSGLLWCRSSRSNGIDTALCRAAVLFVAHMSAIQLLWLMAGLCACTATVQPQTLGTIPLGQTSEPAVATVTGSDLTFAEGLVRSGYLRPTAVPSGPTGVNPTPTQAYHDFTCAHR